MADIRSPRVDGSVSASAAQARTPGGSRMIEMRRAQLSFGDGLIAEEVSDLR
jgi:hypothetical protein